MRAFLQNLTVRPSCFNCPAKCPRSSADITLGDFWGINQLCPEIDDDRGVTLVIEHNERNLTDIQSQQEFALTDGARYNQAIVKSAEEPANRAKFYDEIGASLTDTMRSYTRLPLILSIRIKLARTIHKLIKCSI
jgi:hypothetical protein